MSKSRGHTRGVQITMKRVRTDQNASTFTYLLGWERIKLSLFKHAFAIIVFIVNSDDGIDSNLSILEESQRNFVLTQLRSKAYKDRWRRLVPVWELYEKSRLKKRSHSDRSGKMIDGNYVASIIKYHTWITFIKATLPKQNTMRKPCVLSLY